MFFINKKTLLCVLPLIAFLGCGKSAENTSDSTVSHENRSAQQIHKNINSVDLGEQSGILDESFADNGIASLKFESNSAAFYRSVVLADGSILSGGYVTTQDKINLALLAKFKADGSLDENFGNKGTVQTEVGKSASINSLSVLNDGSIIAVGSSTNPPAGLQSIIIKYDSNGFIQKSFGKDGMVIISQNTINGLSHAVTSDGSIVIGGYLTGQNNTMISALVKYKPNGELDTSFGQNGFVKNTIGKVSSIKRLVIHKSGMIIAAGNSDQQFLLLKFYSNGMINNSFGKNGIVTFKIKNSANLNTVSVENDGSIITGGSISEYQGSEIKMYMALAKFDSHGKLVTSFAENGVSLIRTSQYDMLNHIETQKDGSIVGVSYSRDNNYNSQYLFLKYNSDGSLNYNFGQEGIVFGKSVTPGMVFTSVNSMSDGSLLVTGFNEQSNAAAVAKFN